MNCLRLQGRKVIEASNTKQEARSKQFLLSYSSNPEDGTSTFLQNAGDLSNISQNGTLLEWLCTITIAVTAGLLLGSGSYIYIYIEKCNVRPPEPHIMHHHNAATQSQ
jgi:hypothetical protein